MEKEYIAKEPELIKYLATVRSLERKFQGFTLKHILRGENSKADELAKATVNNLPLLEGTFSQELKEPVTVAT